MIAVGAGSPLTCRLRRPLQRCSPRDIGDDAQEEDIGVACNIIKFTDDINIVRTAQTRQ